MWQLVHVTKTGGTALEEWGYAHGFRWGYRHPRLRAARFVGPYEAWHAPMSLMRLLRPRLHRAVYEGARTFCVVRHPVCRMLSEANCPFHGMRETNGSVKAFVLARLAAVDRAFPAASHGIALVPWYADCDRHLRYESLAADFAAFARRELGVGARDAALPRRNPPRGRHRIGGMPRALVARVERAYALDMRRFNYSSLLRRGGGARCA